MQSTLMFHDTILHCLLCMSGGGYNFDLTAVQLSFNVE